MLLIPPSWHLWPLFFFHLWLLDCTWSLSPCDSLVPGHLALESLTRSPEMVRVSMAASPAPSPASGSPCAGSPCTVTRPSLLLQPGDRVASVHAGPGPLLLPPRWGRRGCGTCVCRSAARSARAASRSGRTLVSLRGMLPAWSQGHRPPPSFPAASPPPLLVLNHHICPCLPMSQSCDVAVSEPLTVAVLSRGLPRPLMLLVHHLSIGFGVPG